MAPGLRTIAAAVTTALLWAAATVASAADEPLRIAPPDAPHPAQFGTASALDGDTLVIGAPRNDTGERGTVYVYGRGEAGWVEAARLTVPEGEDSYNFGAHVDVSGDTVIAGGEWAIGYAVTPRVYRRGPEGFELEAVLTSALPSHASSYGAAVAIDGDTAVVGAFYDEVGEARPGGAYVWQRSGTTWSLTAQLRPDTLDEVVFFGREVAVSGDTVLVGSPFDSDVDHHSGAVYVYRRDGAGWALEEKVTLPFLGFNFAFGSTLAIDGDRFLAWIGDSDVTVDNGAVHVFVRREGRFVLETRLEPRGHAVRGRYGASLALDGNRAVVGAPGWFNTGANAGAAFTWMLDGGGWTNTARLLRDNAHLAQRFGGAVSITDRTFVVCAPHEDDERGDFAGAAYVHADASELPIIDPRATEPAHESAVNGFLIPERARLTRGRNRRVIVTGQLDLGGERPGGLAPINLASHAFVHLGPRTFSAPRLSASSRGRVLRYRDDTFRLRIRRPRGDRSRATFRMESDETAPAIEYGDGRQFRVTADGRAYLNIQVDGLDARGALYLERGRYVRDRRGGRSTVDTKLLRLDVRDRGGARDSARLRVALPDAVATTPALGRVGVSIGDLLDVAFEAPVEDTDGNVTSETSLPSGRSARLTIDRTRATLDLRVDGADIGTLPTGPHGLTISLDIDGVRRSIRVIAGGRGGRRLRY